MATYGDNDMQQHMTNKVTDFHKLLEFMLKVCLPYSGIVG